jgi:CheY-like chemotaxis protein
MDLYMPALDGIKATQAIREFLSDKIDIKTQMPVRPHICMLSSADM